MYRVLKDEMQQDKIDTYAFQALKVEIREEQKTGAQKEEDYKVEQERKRQEEERKLQERIEEILRAAEKEGEIRRKKAQEQGYAAGYAEGYRSGEEKAQEDVQARYEEDLTCLREDVKVAIESITTAKAELLNKYLEDLKNISVAVAEKVIQTSLKSSGEVIKRMILSATDKLKKKSWAKIYVAKTNEGLSLQGDTELLRELSNLSDNVKIIVMEEEEPGTCIVELPDEIMDVSAATQLETIKEILHNARLMKPQE